MFAKQLLTIERCTGVAVVLAAADGRPPPRPLVPTNEEGRHHARDTDADGDRAMERKRKLSALAPENGVDTRLQRLQRPLEAPRHYSPVPAEAKVEQRPPPLADDAHGRP